VWLQWTAAVFGGIAGVVNLGLYTRSKKKAFLFYAVTFLLMSGIFFYLAMT